MTHDLRQAMQRHRLRLAVANTVAEVMWAEVDDLGQPRLFRDEIAQPAFRERRRRLAAIRQRLLFVRHKQPRARRPECRQILAEHLWWLLPSSSVVLQRMSEVATTRSDGEEAEEEEADLATTATSVWPVAPPKMSITGGMTRRSGRSSSRSSVCSACASSAIARSQPLPANCTPRKRVSHYSNSYCHIATVRVPIYEQWPWLICYDQADRGGATHSWAGQSSRRSSAPGCLLVSQHWRRDQHETQRRGGARRSGVPGQPAVQWTRHQVEFDPNVLHTTVLCSDARLVEQAGRWQIYGDPTEGTLLVAAAKAGLDTAAIETQAPRVSDLPYRRT